MMHISDAGIRKAAVLVAALDQAAADAVLDLLGDEGAARVRQAMIALGDVAPQEQRRVIDDFFDVATRQPTGNAAVELDAGLAGKLGLSPRRDHGRATLSARVSAHDNAPPFRFLAEAEADKLARVLAGERPQTIALVLAHLPAEQSGGVLSRLQAAQQVEVVQRLVDLEEADPQTLREVEQALHARLASQIQMQRRRVAGLSAVSSILRASGNRVTMQILDNVAAHDQLLAERLTPPAPPPAPLPPPLNFNDLLAMDDRMLMRVVAKADPLLVTLALTGAPPHFVERILRRLPQGDAEQLRCDLNQPGPIRLSDVEHARQRLADLATEMLAISRPRAEGGTMGESQGARTWRTTDTYEAALSH
jgi:flagellar motor switch protein FliG